MRPNRIKRTHLGDQRLSHDWEAQTFAQLAWHYGPEKASLIQAGYDCHTNADLAAWRALGGGK